jgi:two-component system sensor histidine kinase SenX3
VTALLVAICVVAVAVAALQSRRAARARNDLAARERLVSAIEERLDRARDDIHRLTAALDEVPQGVVMVGADGREVLRNVAAGAFVGARHGDALVGQAVREELAATLGGPARRRDLDLFGPPRRQLAIVTAPLDGGGAVAVIDDVSERRRLDAMRRDFVANISHELKTPVGALAVLAETIVDADDPETIDRLAQRMTGEAQRVGMIIDDLLSLSRIEAEELPPGDRVRISDVVHDAVDRVHAVADDRRISIDSTGVDPAHIVVGDHRQLVSAVANLLDNACKYSEPGSAVVITSRTDAGWIELFVTDHGIGIPSSDLDRVFERFYRVDRARSRDTGGTGLGLAIVRHVATNHRGEARVHSVEGQGSTFTLRLPT